MSWWETWAPVPAGSLTLCRWPSHRNTWRLSFLFCRTGRDTDVSVRLTGGVQGCLSASSSPQPDSQPLASQAVTMELGSLMPSSALAVVGVVL